MPLANSGTFYSLGVTPVQKLYRGSVQVWPQTPVPVITNIVPTEMHHAEPLMLLTVNGTGFVAESQVLVTGTVQSDFTLISPTQVTVMCDGSNTGQADLSWPVIVRNPAPGGDSNAATLTVVPEPTLTSISPTSRLTTDPVTTITLTGTNFTPECVVKTDSGNMGGSTFVNRTTMTCITDWATVQTQNLKVVDEKGHETVSKPFTVTAAPPTVTSVVGWAMGYATDITVTGTGFTAPMTLEFGNNGGDCQPPLGPFTVDVVSATQATATAPGQVDTHWSIRGSNDLTHDARVTTPAGTSAWLVSQYVGLN